MSKVCYTWGNSGFRWENANWTWDECQLVSDCVKWGNTGVLWNNANWRWLECSGSVPIPPSQCMRWGSTGILWKDANWLWSQCSSSVIPPIPPVTVVLQPPGIDATTIIQPWLIEPWNPYRAGEREDNRKKWIKLICKVKGQTYTQEKESTIHQVSVDDVKMVVKVVANVDLDIKKREE